MASSISLLVMAVRFALGKPGLRKGKNMKKKIHKLDLVLKCVVIGHELMKFANELVAFLNTVLNYHFRNEPQVGVKIRAQTSGVGQMGVRAYRGVH